MLTAPPVKPPNSPHASKLAELIKQEIATNPFKKDCYKWANRPIEWYGKALGLSIRTIRGLLAKPPFDRLVIMNNDKKITLIRVKKSDEPMTITHCQRILQKIWMEEIGPFNERKAKLDAYNAEQCQINMDVISKEIAHCEKSAPQDKKKLAKLKDELGFYEDLKKRHMKRSAKAAKDAKKTWKPSRKEYGCLRGLVKAWGTSKSPALFRMVIRDWSEFMTVVKLRITELVTDGEKAYDRYFELPSIPVILRFNEVATEMKLQRLKEEFPKIADKHVDPGLPFLEKQEQTVLLWNKLLNELKPEAFPEDAG